ncbi:MAG: universal stress protein [Armatimonadota bacterium]
MYKKILLPLDGSELAEAAIPHAKSLALAFNAQITLISIIEPITMYTQPGMIGPVMDVPVDIEEEIDSAEKYLTEIKSKLDSENIKTDTVTLAGYPAVQICDYAEDNAIDMIVMSTHGRSGIQRWVYGSVADRVLRAAKTPILLVRVTEGR